jgi:hypothetical protein
VRGLWCAAIDDLAVTDSAGALTALSGHLDGTYRTFSGSERTVSLSERYFNNSINAPPVAIGAKIIHRHCGGIRSAWYSRCQCTCYAIQLRVENTGWRGHLQQVLDMTTGVRFEENYTNPYSDIGQLDVASRWKPIPPDSDPGFKWPRHMWELITGLSAVDRPHGELFAYRSIETDVLAFCMERASGRLAHLVSETL